MKIKKRHIVLSALVLTLAGAVFLNWQLSATQQKPDNNRELGVATYVNSNINSSSDEVAVSSASISSNSSLSQEQLEYFSVAKSERQKTQDEVISLATSVFEMSEASEEAMEDAAEQLAKLEDNILSQSRIEVTIKGKGFSECLCCLDETSCTVIVPENEMQENSALIIMDCVSDVSGLPFENINIVGA
ncbi:MAG: SpoIIIAH-like family protein [Ruminococcaceae bacterium]|nr:SpoIIIAH-like family protein [Oscillospiraceae bacterium]